MKKQWLKNFILLALMLASSALAVALKPTQRIADKGPKVNLEAMIPSNFSDWHEEKQSSAQIVDPRTKEMLDKLYSQTLSRTYVNTKGDRVMLSIAYGEDQSDTSQLHYPEVCYPAQGFQVLSNRVSTLDLPQGQIPVRRLESVLNDQRYEPITYWTVIGDHAVLGGASKKIAEIRYGLRGEIPDGLLFRVSTISRDTAYSFNIQDQFVQTLIKALPAAQQLRLAGLGARK